MKILVIILIFVLIVQTLIYIYVSLIERPLYKQMLFLQQQAKDNSSFYLKERVKMEEEIAKRDAIIRAQNNRLMEIELNKKNDDESTI